MLDSPLERLSTSSAARKACASWFTGTAPAMARTLAPLVAKCHTGAAASKATWP